MSSDSLIVETSNEQLSAEWREVELLHQHGSQSVYRIQQYGHRFILKAAPSSDATAVHRLRKEFEIGMQLEHPNIVHTLDFGHDDRVGDYIRMEWIDGCTLSDFIATNPARPIRLRLIEQLLDAVAHLHVHQIVHRDLKPSNILVTRNGNNLKLIDFGLSDSDDSCVFKQPAGTLSYVAPEQMNGDQPDVRADIYSLGKLIAFILPNRFTHITRTCTEICKEKRYPSVAALQQAIRRRQRLRRAWPIIGLLIALLLSLSLSLILFFRPDPREAVIQQAQDLMTEQYERICVPYSSEDRSALILRFYLRCAEVRDSAAATIENESLRNDFLNAAMVTAGQLASQYAAYPEKD